MKLRWSDVDLVHDTIYCRRAQGVSVHLHPLKRDEVAALERVLGQRKRGAGEFVYCEQCTPRTAGLR